MLLLLWLWCRPAAAAPIQPLAWELPHATGVALKRKKKKSVSIYESWIRKRVQILIPFLTFSMTLGNFLDFLDEKANLLARRVVGTRTGDNESSLLNESSIHIWILFGESYEYKYFIQGGSVVRNLFLCISPYSEHLVLESRRNYAYCSLEG